MEKSSKPQRRPRAFTDEFEVDAGRLVLEEGHSASRVAKGLGLTETVLRSWVKQAKADAGKGAPGGLINSEKDELSRVRAENRVLKMERYLKKGGGLLREREPVRFSFIHAEKAV